MSGSSVRGLNIVDSLVGMGSTKQYLPWGRHAESGERYI